MTWRFPNVEVFFLKDKQSVLFKTLPPIAVRYQKDFNKCWLSEWMLVLTGTKALTSHLFRLLFSYQKCKFIKSIASRCKNLENFELSLNWISRLSTGFEWRSSYLHKEAMKTVIIETIRQPRRCLLLTSSAKFRQLVTAHANDCTIFGSIWPPAVIRRQRRGRNKISRFSLLL